MLRKNVQVILKSWHVTPFTRILRRDRVRGITGLKHKQSCKLGHKISFIFQNVHSLTHSPLFESTKPKTYFRKGSGLNRELTKILEISCFKAPHARVPKSCSIHGWDTWSCLCLCGIYLGYFPSFGQPWSLTHLYKIKSI